MKDARARAELTTMRERADFAVKHYSRPGGLWVQFYGRDVMELLDKLDAVRGFAEKLAKGHVSGTWQGLVKRELLAILEEQADGGCCSDNPGANVGCCPDSVTKGGD